jgi:hypothetical protein
MRKWEEIIKDKMEEFDESLPESVFAEFQSRLDGASPVPKRFPLVLTIVPAVAAGLAAVLLLRKPSVSDEVVQIIQRPDYPVAVVADSTETVDTIIQNRPLVAQAVTQKVIGHSYDLSQEPSAIHRELENADYNELEEETEIVISNDNMADDSATSETDVATVVPIIPESIGEDPIKIKITPTAGVIAGSSVLAAIVTPVINSRNNRNNSHNNELSLIDLGPGVPLDSTDIIKLTDLLTGPNKHNLPIKTGLSVRIPVSGRLGITTGLEYSLYHSIFKYSLSGEKEQFAHYLGIPVRLDWNLASNRWFGVFVGGGFMGDYCIGASLAGDKIKGDGLTFSVLGAAGAQFNITKRTGLYLEPELNWAIPSDNHVLETYRSEHPFMFSIATGLRINFGK